MIFLERTDLYLYGFIYLYGLASEFCCRVTWFKFIGSLQIPVYKLFLKKKRHADKSASTQLIIVCESPSSCNLKCEIGYIIPISSGVNQTLLKTGLCREQVPFLQWGVSFERPFSHLSHFIILKNAKYWHVLRSALVGLYHFSSPIKANQKYTSKVLSFPELLQSPQGSQCPRSAQGNFWEQFLLEAEWEG